MKKAIPLTAIILSAFLIVPVLLYVKNWKIKKEYSHLKHIPEEATSYTIIDVNSLVKNIAHQRIWDGENYTKIVDIKYEKEFMDAILNSGLDLNENAAIFSGSNYVGSLLATKNPDGFKTKIDHLMHKYPKVKEKVFVTAKGGTGLILFGNKEELKAISENIFSNTSNFNLDVKNEMKSVLKYEGHDIYLENDITEKDIITDFAIELNEDELKNFELFQNRTGAFSEETEGLVLSAPFFLFKSKKILSQLAPEMEQAILKHGEFMDLNITGSQVNFQSQMGCPSIFPLYEMYIQLDNVEGFLSDLNANSKDSIKTGENFELQKCFNIKGKIEDKRLHLTTFSNLSKHYSNEIKPNNVFSLTGEFHNTLHTVKGLGGNFAKEQIDNINELENLEGEIKLNGNKAQGKFVSTLRKKGNPMAEILGMITNIKKYEMVLNMVKNLYYE